MADNQGQTASVENEITVDAVRDYIEANKSSEEVVGILKDIVPEFVETETGKQVLQPKFDSFFSKGLETWKEKSMPSIIEEEIAKRNPDETPEQKRIRELEEKLQAQERNAQLSDLKSKTAKELSTKGIPTELVDIIAFDSEEGMRDTVGKLAEIFEAYGNKEVQNRLKENGRTPDGKQSTGKSDVMTKEKLLKMSTPEATKFYNENPELFQKLMSQ